MHGRQAETLKSRKIQIEKTDDGGGGLGTSVAHRPHSPWAIRHFSFTGRLRRRATIACAVAGATVLPEGVWADAFSSYRLVSQFNFPAGADVFDVLNDGRLICLVDENVHVETARHARTFALQGVLPNAPFLGFPSFLRVSPNGMKIAVGDGVGQVGVFEVSTLSGDWFSAAHFDAEWSDNRHLALSGAAGGSVTLLDTQSLDPGNPTNPLIIVNKGVPGGITFDVAGNLYTANGFNDSPPPDTGDIKFFSFADWTNAVATSSPLDFLNDGTLIVNLLSGASLGFDNEGNFHVGGGDFFGGTEVDFVGLVRASAVGGAIGGGGAADPGDPMDVRRLDPDTLNSFDFYAVLFNPLTRELYLQNFGESTVYVYVDVSVIPTLSDWGFTALALLLVTSATLLIRGRARSRPTVLQFIARGWNK